MKRSNIIFVLIALTLALILTCGALVACKDAEAPVQDGVTEQPSQPSQSEQNGQNDEYTLALEEGKNQLTLYWTYPGGVEIATSDIWMWWDGKDGSGYLMHECEYGAKVVINVPESVEQVGFIVRTGCSDPGGNAWGTATKDYSTDRFAIITGKTTVIYLKSGDGNQYKSDDGGKTLEQIKLFTIANMMNMHAIQYNVTPAVKIESLDSIKVFEGEREIAIESLSSLNNTVVTGVIKTAEELDVTKAYTVSIEGYGSKPVVPLGVFGSAEFGEKYNYDGWLGSKITGTATEFRVWAPTASKVKVNIFEAGEGGSAKESVDMQKGEKGVWSTTLEGVGHGTYYTYTVTTSIGTQEAVDPYAKAAGVNGNRGMVVDLSATNPENWSSVTHMNNIKRYTDAVIWEVHVRDFSNKIASSQYKGKYLAFTERGLKNSNGIPVGVDYLRDLGVTHVHLMPVYDYATVNEADPDSEFNWGYDPKNYNVPEGSYSTDPYRGEVRINEFKRMVQSLHEAGLSVVMDVVYNHTYDANSSLNKIVPYYYYRYTASGANSSASGCGNDTASERYMYRKFMVDSVVYWTQEYKVDGFRFDLMGLHDLATMDAIEKAVHAINPNALLYGEGWTMGSTTDGSAQANQSNIKKIKATQGAAGSVAVFNDVIRDGLKGSVFNSTSKAYVNGAAASNVNAVKFAINGGSGFGSSWTVNNSNIINYMSCHDNLSLWDKLSIANAKDSLETRLAMNRLGASIIMVSQGTPFMQAGEEMLRSKDGDENSYKSSDAVNNIDWELLSADSDQYKMSRYYKGLIALRKSTPMFTESSAAIAHTFDVNSKTGFMSVLYHDNTGVNKNDIRLVINPTADRVAYDLPAGEWNLFADGVRAGTTALRTDSGSVTVPAYSMLIYIKK